MSKEIEELKDVVAKATWPAVVKIMDIAHNTAIDDAIAVVNGEASLWEGEEYTPPFSFEKIILQLQNLKK
jgi:hypothetical protein